MLTPPFTSLALSPAASAVATQVLTTAMRFILGLVHANPCSPPPPSPPHYLDLSASTLLQKLTETVHNTSDPASFLRDASVQRGFVGTLSGLRIQGKAYTVSSGATGLSIALST